MFKLTPSLAKIYLEGSIDSLCPPENIIENWATLRDVFNADNDELNGAEKAEVLDVTPRDVHRFFEVEMETEFLRETVYCRVKEGILIWLFIRVK